MPKMLAAGFPPDRRAVLVFSVLALGALATCGCSQVAQTCDTSDNGNPSDVYDGGTVQGGTYMSSPWVGPLLHFPGGKRYDLVHRLGCTPRDVSVWLAFSQGGTSGGDLAPSAGNMSLVQVIDDKVVRIKNDTCSDFYVLVTASCGGSGGADAAAMGDGSAEARAE